MVKHTNNSDCCCKLCKSPPPLLVGGEPYKSDTRSAVPRVLAATGRKRGTKAALQAAAEPVHTLELKHGTSTPAHPYGRLAQNRAYCLETADFLQSRVGKTDDILRVHSHRIRSCSLLGAFRSLNTGVNYKIGQALCKSRLCPNCQRVLSTKRKNNFLDWYELNEPQMRGYRRYHMVLTVRHSAIAGVRTGLYTSELLAYFAALRGAGTTNNRARRKWWTQRVAGGTYSVELKPGRDGSPHIHIHCVLLAKMPLWSKNGDSAFLKQAKSAWLSITGDSDNVFIEPVYYTTPDGEKVYAEKGTAADAKQALAECMKYTLKTDTVSLSGYSSEFLRELVTFRNRYYGRFGVLSKKDKLSAKFEKLEMLCTDFKDLEQIKQQELLQLYDPETGELCPPEAVMIAVTHFANTKAMTGPEVHPGLERGGGNAALFDKVKYFSIKNAAAVGWYQPHEKKEVAMHLAKSMKKAYLPENEIAQSTK